MGRMEGGMEGGTGGSKQMHVSYVMHATLPRK